MGTHRPLLSLVPLAGPVIALASGASLVTAEPPTPIPTPNLIISFWLHYVPLVDLGCAAGGMLIVNPRPLAAFAASSRAASGNPRGVGAGIARTAFVVGLAGQEIANAEDVLAGPVVPALSLNFLAHLLGGHARFDSGLAA